MVDPVNFTDFDRSYNELQEVVIFGILVAGKNALTTARQLDCFLSEHKGSSPFEKFRQYPLNDLPVVLRDYGFGCYNIKAKGIHQLVNSNIDLKTCTIDELEEIYCIGMKTSRLFVLHTRRNAKCMPLDVHNLHYLRDLGYNVPKNTPSSKKKYLEIEELCIRLAEEDGKSCAQWDLDIWVEYSGNRRTS